MSFIVKLELGNLYDSIVHASESDDADTADLATFLAVKELNVNAWPGRTLDWHHDVGNTPLFEAICRTSNPLWVEALLTLRPDLELARLRLTRCVKFFYECDDSMNKAAVLKLIIAESDRW